MPNNLQARRLENFFYELRSELGRTYVTLCQLSARAPDEEKKYHHQYAAQLLNGLIMLADELSVSPANKEYSLEEFQNLLRGLHLHTLTK